MYIYNIDLVQSNFPASSVKRLCARIHRVFVVITATDGITRNASIGMQCGVYYGLINASWMCVHCGLPNFPKNIFDTTIFLTSNSFSYLNETNNSNTTELMPLHLLQTSYMYQGSRS